MRKAVLFTLIIFLSTCFVSAIWIYDDFSSGVLDSSKWIESIAFHGGPFTDEHFVDISEEVYHIKQNVARDAETNLRPTIQFSAGDVFSYDAIYISGSGNHASQPLINGNYPPSQVEACNFQTAGCGAIGYWNALPDLGAQVGTYKITYEFFHDQVKMTTLRPDNVSVINTFTGNAEPYTLDINTHTGHNGLIHIDYDNFVLKKCRFVPSRNTYICLEKIDPNEPVIRITPTFP